MPAKIGTSHHAKLALKMFSEGGLYDEDSPFEVIGTGSIRKALLHLPTQVVYKVEYTNDMGGWRKGYSNEVEYTNVRKLEKMLYPDRWWSTRVRIPLVSCFTVGDASVVAMQYIKGKRGSAASVHWNFIVELQAIGIGDMHEANYVVDDEGTLWPIDLGCNFNGPREVVYDDWD